MRQKTALAVFAVLLIVLASGARGQTCSILPSAQSITAGEVATISVTSDFAYPQQPRADWGDGTSPQLVGTANPTPAVTTNTITANHPYFTTGTFTALVRFNTASGIPVSCASAVTVNAAAPSSPTTTISSPASQYLKGGQPTTIAGTANAINGISSVVIGICCADCQAPKTLVPPSTTQTTWNWNYYDWAPPNRDIPNSCIIRAHTVDATGVTGSDAQVTASIQLSSSGSYQTSGATTPACSVKPTVPTLTSAGSDSLLVFYENLDSGRMGTAWSAASNSWTATLDCGNNKTTTATCSGTTGNCQASCSYSSNGNYVIKLAGPANYASLCGQALVRAEFSAAPNATSNVSVPIATPSPELFECAHNECEWQQECYPEGAQNPAYNDSGNCFYGVCSGGKWLPKPEGTACGGGSLCCAGVCRPAECVSGAECSNRIYEGKACYKFSCAQPGTCAATCEPEISPSNCGGAGCAPGSPEYCANLACNPHEDRRCDCGETPDDYPDECTQQTEALTFLLNNTASSPATVILGRALNVTIPYESPVSLASVSCDESGCQCSDQPDQQAVLCQLTSAVEQDYHLAATDSKNRTYRTAFRVSALGVTGLVVDTTPEWQKWLYGIGALAAIGILIGGAYAARAKMLYDSPPEEYKRVVRQMESFGTREKTLMGMYMQGKLSDRALAEQRKLLEKEERDANARKKELEQSLGPAKAAELEKGTKDAMLEERAKAAIKKSLAEEKKPPSEGMAGGKPYTGKF